jgi:putative endonuclease
MYYVYILKSLTKGKYYIGQTNNLVRRVREHNTKRNKSTKSDAPWKLVFKKSFPNRLGAVKLENRLKGYKKRVCIEKFINNQ